MITREQSMRRGGLDGYSNFIGDDSEYRDWYDVIGRTRDSEAISESNFRVALRLLGGEGPDVRVERYGHWAVGWIEEIYVRPGSQACKTAEEIRERLDDYPILDEEDLSLLEENSEDEEREEQEERHPSGMGIIIMGEE